MECIALIDGWVNRGGPVHELQDTIVQTCGKLVKVTVNAFEKLSLRTTQRDEFHFRADLCSKMTVDRVYPEPEFENKEEEILAASAMTSNQCDRTFPLGSPSPTAGFASRFGALKRASGKGCDEWRGG
jgi:hypothetical protein